MYRSIVSGEFAWLAGHENGWQFGEQGVLDEIVSVLDLPKLAVEFGAGNGTTLPVTIERLIKHRWSAVLVEADKESADALTHGYAEIADRVKVVCGKVTADDYSAIPQQPIGVVVVDVDGDDYEIAAEFPGTPAVFVVEHRDELDPENPRVSDVGGKVQANVLAVSAAMTSRGYTPVWSGRVNAIYVRSDLAGRLSRHRSDFGGKTLTITGSSRLAYPIEANDETVGNIDVTDTLRLFDRWQADRALAEWFRVLKPGGTIRVVERDAALVSREVEKPSTAIDPESMLIGGTQGEGSWTKSLYDEAGLVVAMQQAGFMSVQRFAREGKTIAIEVRAIKPTVAARSAAWRSNTIAIMSAPRVTFTDAVQSIGSVIHRLGIPLHIQQGVFWGQCIERGLEQALTSKAEWVLTFDYDTVFTVEDVVRLYTLADSDPTIDAIAPLQCKRGDATVLLNVEKKGDGISCLRGPVADVTLAHFGCTLIRTSAIRKMSKPWFWAQPGKDNGWGDERIDDDVYFWRKFREAGNRVVVATRVSVGHLQSMVTWPDEQLRPIHQYAGDWYAKGKPANVRH